MSSSRPRILWPYITALGLLVLMLVSLVQTGKLMSSALQGAAVPLSGTPPPAKVLSCPLYEQLTAPFTEQRDISLHPDFLQVPVGNHSVLYIDVPASTWFALPLKHLTVTHMIAGSETTSTGAGIGGIEAGVLLREFKGEDRLTFAALAKMISLTAGLPVTTLEPRNSTAIGHWSAPFVARVEKAGVSGFDVLDINTFVTRAEFINAVVEAFAIPVSVHDTSFYSDIYPGYRYRDPIESATRFGIIYGDQDAGGNLLYTFRPTDLINRAEAISILNRALRVVCRLEGLNFPYKETPVVEYIAPAESIDPEQENLEQICFLFEEQQSAEPEKRGDLLYVSTEDGGLLFEDVGALEPMAPLLSALARARVIGGESTGRDLLITTDPALQRELTELQEAAEGPALLGASKEDAHIRQSRYFLLQAILELQGSVESVPMLRFSPSRTVTLAEMAVMVTRAAGYLPADHAPTSILEIDHWAASSIARLEDAGVSPLQISPLDPASIVTRGAFMQVVMEAFGYSIPFSSHLPFDDMYAGYRYNDAIVAALNAGLIEGDRARDPLVSLTVRPNDALTRTEALQILYRAMSDLCLVAEEESS